MSEILEKLINQRKPNHNYLRLSESTVPLTQSVSVKSEAKKLILQYKPKCEVHFSLVTSFHFMSKWIMVPV